MPFNGSAPSTTALLGGHVHALFQNIDSILPYMKAGTVVPLTIAADARSAHLPDVPTFAEAGVPGVINETWFSIVAPAGVPADILATLREKSRAIVESKEYRAFINAQNADPLPAGADAFQSFLKDEDERWARVLKNAAVRIN